MSLEVQCGLCPKGCRLLENQRGDCRARVNLGGKLRTLTYGRPCSIHVDPVEKKPLFHFYPASSILSLACAGCNLHCKNCQNWQISQVNPEDIEAYRISSSQLVALAKKEGCRMLAYTYTDPVAFYEYALDSSHAARQAGLKNVLVTAGYANRDPLKKLYRVSDAANIDLKFFDDAMYRRITTATLAPVLDALVLAKEMGVWLEVTHLIIPTLNDDFELIGKMCKWIVRNLGRDVPLHFSRFFPHHLLTNLEATPPRTLARAKEIAVACGIRYVYIGNLPGEGEDTYCPYDNKLLIKRNGYIILENNLKEGRCPDCGRTPAGVWQEE